MHISTDNLAFCIILLMYKTKLYQLIRTFYQYIKERRQKLSNYVFNKLYYYHLLSELTHNLYIPNRTTLSIEEKDV